MGKSLPGARNEIPIAFNTTRLDLRSVTMVLYQRDFFSTCFYGMNHYELNKLQEELQDLELKSMLT